MDSFRSYMLRLAYRKVQKLGDKLARVEGPEPGMDGPLSGFKARSLGKGGWNRPSKQETEENQNPHIFNCTLKEGID